MSCYRSIHVLLSFVMVSQLPACAGGDDPKQSEAPDPVGEKPDPEKPDPETPEPHEETLYKNDTYRFDGAKGELPQKFESHLPECEEMLPLADLPIRLFADDGHLFYFEVTPAAARAGDAQACDPATPAEGVECPISATNVRVKPFGMEVCADTGKVELGLRGGKNFRPWLYIPTLSLDSGEFEPQKFGEGDSQLRFQNGQGGRTIIREAVALRIWQAMGFPVPENSFVKTQSNVWDTAIKPGTWAAHLLMQRYKKTFFDQQMPDVVHVWEGEGDPFAAKTLAAGWTEVDCEWSSEEDCDDKALQTVVSKVRAAPAGADFYKITSSLIDWPSVHAFQCLSALTDTSKDWIHDSDSVVLALSAKGQVRYLPKNLDRSGGVYADEGKPTSYRGAAYLLKRCEADPDCVAAGVAVCSDLLDDFEQLDASQSIVEERCSTLEALDLAREGDGEACTQMKKYYKEAAARVREEISQL